MAQPELASIAGASPEDLRRTMLPKNVVAVVIGLAFLPIILNGLGIRFSAASTAPVAQEAVEGQLQPAPVPPEINRGAIIYLLLEWTAFMIALATVVLAVTHYFITHDVTTPIISTALFFSGTIDAFEAMAAVNLLPITVDDINRFLPFTWFVSRLVNVCFLIAGTLPFVCGHVVSHRFPVCLVERAASSLSELARRAPAVRSGAAFSVSFCRFSRSAAILSGPAELVFPRVVRQRDPEHCRRIARGLRIRGPLRQ
jgi:hypothetical protein